MAPMYGVNTAGQSIWLRIVPVQGQPHDFVVPAGKIVTLEAQGEVAFAVIMDQHCHVRMVTPFGNGNNPFAYGGALFADQEGGFGYTSDLPSGSGQGAAEPDDTCADTPTPPCDRSPGGNCAPVPREGARMNSGRGPSY